MTNRNSPSLPSSTTLTYTGTDNSLQSKTLRGLTGYNPNAAMRVPGPSSDINQPSGKGAENAGTHQQQHNWAPYHASNDTMRPPEYNEGMTPQVINSRREDNRHAETMLSAAHNSLRLPSYSNNVAPQSQDQDQYRHQQQQQHQHEHENQVQQQQQQLQPQHQQQSDISLRHYSNLLNANPGLDMNSMGVEQYDHAMDMGFIDGDNGVVSMAMGNPVMNGVYQYDDNDAGVRGEVSWDNLRW